MSPLLFSLPSSHNVSVYFVFKKKKKSLKLFARWCRMSKLSTNISGPKRRKESKKRTRLPVEGLGNELLVSRGESIRLGFGSSRQGSLFHFYFFYRHFSPYFTLRVIPLCSWLRKYFLSVKNILFFTSINYFYYTASSLSKASSF